MPETQPLFVLLKRLWRYISAKRRKQFAALLVLMVLSSFAEIVSIGAVIPFLGVLTHPQGVFEYPLLQPLIQFFDIGGPEQLLLPLTVAFSIAALLAGGMRLLFVWASTRLTFAAGADMSSSIYERTLYQPYTVHVSRNSSEVISGITHKANEIIYSVMTPVLVIISSIITLSAILLALISIDPFISLVAFGGFGGIYAVIIRISRSRLAVNSRRIANESTQVIKSLQEGLGGIRDVLIDGTQPIYCQIYRTSDLSLRRAQGSSQFIGIFPRYGIEALGMIFIAILAYGLARKQGGVANAIPVMGALALGAQRMLPMLQQAYGNWTAMRAGQATFQDVLSLLDQPLPDYVSEPWPQSIPFEHSVVLKDVSFRYDSEGPWVLQNIDFVLSKGARIGLIGTTGSGKSTLLDIAMGLLSPTKGTLKVDGVSIDKSNLRGWQAHIAHVPQVIYLADISIAENIAFGISVDRIDMDRVREAARQAQMDAVIEGWPEQYQTRVGERGVRLSGGQRQRIGIARALYKRADVIVFDEATSALDNDTELAVMQAIESLGEDLTVIMIAHRLSTLKKCTAVVELSAGKIARSGTYQSIVAQAA